MTKRMLIDASHAEETRVVVLDGNRLEDFDVETSTKRQLKGNIYLAKVVRVEPSLQAAFVEYGGNRHGFLAFSEIHPDYYQIPVADRQRLLEMEAEEARREEEEDDLELALTDAWPTDSSTSEVDRADDTRRAPHMPGGDDRAATEADGEPRPAQPLLVVPSVISGPVEPDEATRTETSQNRPASSTDQDTAGGGAGAPGLSRNPEGVTAFSGTNLDTGAVSQTGSVPREAPEGGSAASASSVDAGIESHHQSDETRLADEAEPASHPVTEPAAWTFSAPSSQPLAAAGTTNEPPASPETSESWDASPAPQEASDLREPAEPREAASTYAEDRAGDDSDDRSMATRGGAADDTAASDSLDLDDEIDTIEMVPDAPPPETVGGSDQDVGDDPRERRIPPRFLRNYKIQEVIRRRQILLVQVVKEERGTKGAALTTYLSLAGRFSVLMPNSPRGGGISRKITSAADRRRLKEVTTELDLPRGMGLIIRTAGAARPKAEIKRDCEYLLRLWDDIRDHTLKSIAPALIYEEASLIKRAIRDVYSRDIDEILVDGENGWRAAHDFMRMLMPSHAKKVQMWREAGANGHQPLFARYQVESQLDAMLMPIVQLRSGGYLVINQAEALVAIDVNSGRSTRERNIEETALRTNLEAADEVARQLRLRDLAGLIVIDFIDMESKRHNAMVERRLKEALKNDRARIQVGHISHFGLLEMSRQRLRPSLAETSFIACPHCGGTGHVRSTESAAIHVLRGVEDEGGKRRAAEIVVHVATPVALYLLNHKRERLGEIELRYAMRVFISADDTQIAPQYRIERLRAQIAGEALPVITPDLPPPAPIPLIEDADERGSAEDDEADDDADDSADDEGGDDARAENGDEARAENGDDARAENGDADEAERRRRRRRRRRRGRRDEGATQRGPEVEDGALLSEAAAAGEAVPAFTQGPAAEGADDNASTYEASHGFGRDPFEGPSAGPDPDNGAPGQPLRAVDAASVDASLAAGDAASSMETHVEGVPEHTEASDTDEDSRNRRRGRRGGRRRRREGDGEVSPLGLPGAEQPDLVPAYSGPTPANPFGDNAFDIFDIMDQVERGSDVRRPAMAASAASEQIEVARQDAPAAAVTTSPLAAADEITPGAGDAVVTASITGNLTTGDSMPGTAHAAPDEDAMASDAASTLRAEETGDPVQATPVAAEQTEPVAAITPPAAYPVAGAVLVPIGTEPPGAEVVNLSAYQSPAAEQHTAAAVPETATNDAAVPEAANDATSEPLVKPIVIGSGTEPPMEKKRGWWRR